VPFLRLATFFTALSTWRYLTLPALAGLLTNLPVVALLETRLLDVFLAMFISLFFQEILTGSNISIFLNNSQDS
jgi:hypothetical protein